ncbi:RNA ligase/cyclic nucleotide phosphodiesterase [Auriculariales sp. MPI-PUGE-AT-0066]|nr:RNA ligase/cyclic nucleotide phosphodiesterase [Auriculariales sp. MPI-PUGE-AT-0066]
MSSTALPSVVVPNPFEAHLFAADNDITRLREIYEAHRTNRNAQQKSILLAKDFSGISVDSILSRLEAGEPDFVDPRNSFVLWARPSPSVKSLAHQIQERLVSTAPHLWLMPQEDLHTTVIEVAHSLPAENIDAVVEILGSDSARSLVYLAPEGRATLVQPQISIDTSAVALSFLPASSESGFSYHHLRRDAWNRLRDSGVQVESRYTVPSAHITIARFITQNDHATEEGVANWVKAVEDVNEWLRSEWWNREDLEWVVGKDHGLILRKGRVWYGGGETVAVGGCLL